MRALVSGAIYYHVWSFVSIITHVAVLPGSKPETRVSEFEWDRSEQTGYHQPDPPPLYRSVGVKSRFYGNVNWFLIGNELGKAITFIH